MRRSCPHRHAAAQPPFALFSSSPQSLDCKNIRFRGEESKVDQPETAHRYALAVRRAGKDTVELYDAALFRMHPSLASERVVDKKGKATDREELVRRRGLAGQGREKRRHSAALPWPRPPPHVHTLVHDGGPEKNRARDALTRTFGAKKQKSTLTSRLKNTYEWAQLGQQGGDFGLARDCLTPPPPSAKSTAD